MEGRFHPHALQHQSLTITCDDKCLSQLVIRIVEYYRYSLSPLLGPRCRFTPTCSSYCIEAIKSYGIWYGGNLTIRRLLRCHFLTPPGWDPVPPI
uniref:Membrane protein insertion efficiency factor YidD n=1 Tax=Paulinella micropora TaxID=1928728 RepID=A0A385I177_9EUKA|nr:membrane protein insertion efficiency factor YidD [Paulinella micropora]AXY63634.1 membrane protein insertion efficiency factor YidD [Paulinella micropora]